MFMDIRIERRFARFRRWVSKGISKLPKNFGIEKRISPTLKNTVVGFLSIALAGLLAWGAQGLSHSEALKDWESQRLPTEQTWKYALGSRGWAAPGDSRLVQHALRKLPSTMDREGAVWMSPDSNWLTVFRSSEATLPQAIFCRNCLQPPTSWEPLGIGWSGFDRVFQRLDQAPQVKTPKFHDPREIQY